MKKASLLIVFIFLLSSLISCSAANDIVYTVRGYDMMGHSYLGSVKLNGEEIEISDEDKFKRIVTPNEERESIQRPENTPDTYSLTLSGKEYSLTYLSSYQTAFTTDGSQRSVVNTYKCENAAVEFCSATGEIVLFQTVRDKKEDIVVNSEKTAKAVADSFFVEAYGEEAFDEYVYSGTTVSDSDSTELEVKYTRLYKGYLTGDTISVFFDAFGNVVQIWAPYRRYYNNLENDISKKEIENAIAAMELLNKDGKKEFEEHTVTVLADGKYYINAKVKCISIYFDDIFAEYTSEYFVNIE